MKNAIALATIAFFAYTQTLTAQDLRQQFAQRLESFDQQLYRADIEGMEESQRLFERLFDHEDFGHLAHYYYARAEEQKAYLKQDDKGEFLDHLNLALKHLEKAVDKRKEFADAYALMASYTGIKAGLQPIKAMFLGPKADRLMDKANQLEPRNPRVILVKAISDYSKPKFFGGNRERAMEGFRKARRLAADEQTEGGVLPSWGHAEALAWMGNASMSSGDFAAARESFDLALQLEPDYGWVSRLLMPKLESLEKQQK